MAISAQKLGEYFSGKIQAGDCVLSLSIYFLWRKFDFVYPEVDDLLQIYHLD